MMQNAKGEICWYRRLGISSLCFATLEATKLLLTSQFTEMNWNV